MTVLSEPARDALDRIDEIASCWAAVTDLMNTDNDAIQHRQRDNLASLLYFLSREYDAARDAFTKANHASQEVQS